MAKVPSKCLPGDAAALLGAQALTCTRPTSHGPTQRASGSPFAQRAGRGLPVWK